MGPEGYRLDRPVAITCPDCGGAMARESAGALTVFRCHIGHVLGVETVLHAKHHALEEALAHTLVLLNERAELCRLLAEARGGTGPAADRLDAAREEAVTRSEAIRALLESDWTRPAD